MFIQIHTLTSYHATLLNRDEAGLAKRIPFGNTTRLRISSQCLKRHWTENLRDTLDLPRGFRTRYFFSRQVLPRLLEEGVPADLAKTLVRELINLLFVRKEEKKELLGRKEEKKEKKPDDPLKTPQAVLFGKPEADFLVQLIKKCADQSEPEKALELLKGELKQTQKNFKTMLRQAGFGDLYAGIEGALFGRFVTSDILSRSDASVHVAHAFTVHPLDTEIDYFTVVDDLLRDEETGAAHADDMELGAGIYYGYVVVDIPLLISNLTGSDPGDWKNQESSDARTLINGLVRTISTVSPGAKLGSTAPYAYSDFVLLEAGPQQPRSLANAFLHALPADGDMTRAAIDALCRHITAMDSMYGKTADARLVSSTKTLDSTIAKVMNLNEAISTVLDSVFKEK